MKSTLFMLVFCASCFTFLIKPSSSSTKAWIGLEKANRTNIKKYEKHCLGTIYNIGPMDEGEVKRIPGTCALATCQENRDIRFSGCPIVALSNKSKCRVYAGDLSKEYPECCYEIRCNENIRTVENYEGYVNMTAVDIKRKARKDKENEKVEGH